MIPLFSLRVLTLIVALGSIVAGSASELKPPDVPTFRLRGRVISVGHQKPTGKKFSFRFGIAAEAVAAEADSWSEALSFGASQIEKTLKGYPAIYLKGYPVVVPVSVTEVVDPTVVEAELTFDETGETFRLKAELFGPTLGVLVWRNQDKKPQAATMAEYNRRYWKHLASVQIPPEERPKHFPIVDRFIGGDDDRIAWREGLEQLNRAGFSAIMVPPSMKIRELLHQAGQRRTSWAVYSPPGYVFDFDPMHTPESLRAWATEQAISYQKAGFSPEAMAIFALSDEPGWYYPRAVKDLEASPAGLARFRDYLQRQGLKPADVGSDTWAKVQPSGRRQAMDRTERRLFYWTMRFFAHDSARYFADATRALEAAFYPNLPIFTNWNFFAGRFYVPGPVANNGDKDSPEAAMGGHDWFEFARLRGGTMLWTEDWFPDRQAYQWSFYCAKLRSAAEKGNISFGGYIIPRTAGDRRDGIVQKILCVVGSGGKAIKYFVFGPEYNFPGNCYSEKAHLLPKIAEAHWMIGKAERLLWPGKRPRSAVAILMPRSSQVWDAREPQIAHGISDATNVHLNRETVDYMAEVFDLYLALQHANIPVDFVEEDDLSAEGLRPYRVLYVTEPNLPEENQRGLIEWIRAGGILATVTGACQRDRYNDPCPVFREASGIAEQPRDRLLIADVKSLPTVAVGETPEGSFEVIGVKGRFEDPPDGVRLTFQDGSPAIVERRIDRGRVVHFTWMPGLSYWRSAQSTADGLPAGFSEVIRNLIVQPVRQAGVTAPVETNRALIETPLLLSPKGAAVTLLNWTGTPIEELDLTIRVPFPVRVVESVRQGKLEFSPISGGVKLRVPLLAADILMLEP